VNISGGTVSATTGFAVYNHYTGKVTVSGDAKVTSANVTSTQGSIYLGNDASGATETDVWLEITGGTVENTASGNAVYNSFHGAIIISGGTVSATTGMAVFNYFDGAVNITGGTVSASATTGRAVHNESTGIVTISGGEVFAASDYAVVYNGYNGSVNITGGSVLATAEGGNAVVNNSGGSVNGTSPEGRFRLLPAVRFSTIPTAR